MDFVGIIDHGATIEQTIQRLERARARIERILERRGEYIDMVDWTAMTELDRDWALFHMPYDLEHELWSIDCHLSAIVPMQWSYW